MKAIKSDTCYKNCSVCGVSKHNATEDTNETDNNQDSNSGDIGFVYNGSFTEATALDCQRSWQKAGRSSICLCYRWSRFAVVLCGEVNKTYGGHRSKGPYKLMSYRLNYRNDSCDSGIDSKGKQNAALFD